MSDDKQTNGSTEPDEGTENAKATDESFLGAAGSGEPAAKAAEAAATGQPGIHVLGQYIKDLSFENPNAPASLAPGEAAPQLNVNVNVNARRLAEADVEVELKMEATAQRDGKPMFVTEVTYAGVFQIQNVPAEHMQPIMLIECPRLLFPFARQILADATRQGGFPPLMIDPVDFAALYRQKLERVAQQQAEAE
jgi:preprotein translocase subunit SecB